MALFKYLSERRQCSLINEPEMPLPNLNSTNTFVWLVWGQTAKFKDHQYFRLYSSYSTSGQEFMAVVNKPYPQATPSDSAVYCHKSLVPVL